MMADDQVMRLELGRVFAAHKRVSPYIRPTPLLYSHDLSEASGADVWLKPECWQITGSFKVRGALHVVHSLTDAQRARGVVTGSAGNHGLGLAYAARSAADSRGPVRADVFVPTTAPRTKVIKLTQLGAYVHETGRTYEDAHQAAEQFARCTGAHYVSAYDDLDVIAGQGTVGLETMQELPRADLVVVPVGGGGLIAGIASVAKSVCDDVRIVGVQPHASPAALLSLRDGVAYDPYEHEPTIADGLAGGFGRTPLRVAGHLIDSILLASEAQIRRAVYVLLHRQQLVVEPSGAIAIAPLLSGELDLRGQTVVCVLTGGNIETSLLREILQEHGER
jgi:threonine dehydratase